MTSPRTHIDAILSRIPQAPGVYQFFDARGSLLYIGKAKRLAARVRSYFRDNAQLAPDKQRMIGQIHDIQFTLVDSELEALLLETTLIKKHRPPFNIRMTDDKYWQYIKIQLAEDFPRISAVRSLVRDGSRYFGPYTSGLAVRDTLRLIRRIFLYRNCNLDITETGIRNHTQKKFVKFGRPCLDYHIKKCVAPCAGKIARAEYARIIEQVEDFLEGKQTRILRSLKYQMADASAAHQYEKAARLRDQINAVEQIIEKQKVISTRAKNQDIIGLVTSADARAAFVNLFQIRDGKLLDKKQIRLELAEEASDAAQILPAFIQQYYTDTVDIPDELLLPSPIAGAEIFETWLTQQRQVARIGTSARAVKKTRLLVPAVGESRRLVEISIKNAQSFMSESLAARAHHEDRTTGALAKLSAAVGLTTLATRIECYDISNVQGVNAVGSMVVFINGAPAKNQYRRFAIKYTPGPNDFAMMREVVSRRFAHDNTTSAEFAATQPDLIILDGGKGQLSTIVRLFEERGISTPLISLAKREEEVFLPHNTTPVMLPRGSAELHLIQRIRDEAHRFAITYFRARHRKAQTASALDDIPGIGATTRAKLLRAFGSLDGVRAAGDEELGVILNKNQLSNLRAKLDAEK